MVNTKRELQRILKQHEAELAGFGVRRYGLFGSFLHGTVTRDSDVDLLVEFEPEEKTFLNFSNLIFRLEELLGRPVEVVTVESLSPHIGPHILREVEYIPLNA